MKKIGFPLFILLFGAVCHAAPPSKNPFAGFYADEGYVKRKQGHDWVGVHVEPLKNRYYRVVVKSRNDIKKPTCSGSFIAKPADKHTLSADSEAGRFYLVFGKNKLDIRSKNKTTLHYFCSGGGSLARQYRKIR